MHLWTNKFPLIFGRHADSRLRIRLGRELLSLNARYSFLSLMCVGWSALHQDWKKLGFSFLRKFLGFLVLWV